LELREGALSLVQGVSGLRELPLSLLPELLLDLSILSLGALGALQMIRAIRSRDRELGAPLGQVRHVLGIIRAWIVGLRRLGAFERLAGSKYFCRHELRCTARARFVVSVTCFDQLGCGSCRRASVEDDAPGEGGREPSGRAEERISVHDSSC
jgi:hypothetical protein